MIKLECDVLVNGNNFIVIKFLSSNWFVLFLIYLVMLVLVGLLFGGLYLKLLFLGGLCDGVIIILLVNLFGFFLLW